MTIQSLLVGAVALALAGCSVLPGDIDDVEAVTLSSSDIVLTLGDTAQLLATVMNANGQPLVFAPVTWSSNDLLVVQVDSGRLTAVGAGTTSVIAESRGNSASAQVTVRMDLITVAAGGAHTCAVTENSRVACWGTNSSGQIGNGTVFAGATPMLAIGASGVVDIVAGGSHSCAITDTRNVVCWGQNASGQLGLGQSGPGRHDELETVVGGLRFASLTAGERHTCGLTFDGTAYCWGSGFYGQLGVGTAPEVCPVFDEPCSPRPVAVSGGLQFAQLSNGPAHSCGLTLAGETYCWGWNASGQIGDSTLENRAVPTPVLGGITFTSIAAGLFHSCGVATDGRAHCWGSNLRGRLGVSDTLRDSWVPIAVTGPHRFGTLTIGDEHTCGITDNSSVWCWGYNGRAQLGSSSVLRADEPVPAEAPTFATISSGAGHTCGRALDGRVYCWGENTFGQLGTGGFTRARAATVTGQ